MSDITIVKYFGSLNVCQRRDYFTALTAYKSLAGFQPNYIAYIFTLSRDICNPHNKIIFYLQIIFTQSAVLNGADIWNNLPDILRNNKSFNVFKQTLKLSLIFNIV